MNELVENSLLIDFEGDTTTHSFTRLKELGIEQGYVTDEDIRRFFPEAEQNIDLLDLIFLTIYNAGILFIENANLNDSSDEESTEEDLNEANENKVKSREDNPLSNVDPDNLVGLYFCEAARSSLLTFEEEVDLAKRIEQGYIARKEILDIKKKSAKQRKELFHLVDDSRIAVDRLITANSRLVVSIAKKYIQRGVPFLDLIQEGNIGLMRAAKRFDYKRGFKFSTYATWWIRQAVTRALADQSRTIRLPVHRSDQLSKMFRTQHKLRQRLGREPTIAETAESMGVTSKVIQGWSKDAQYPLSLDMQMRFDEDSVFGDFIEDQGTPGPVDVATLSLLRQHLDQILELLPPREAKILKLRFGLSDGETHSLKEVGLIIGVSRERIRQIEAKAIKRLRNPEILCVLRGYLNQSLP